MIESDRAGSSSSPVLRRNRFSCKKCRTDRKGCLPVDRNWEQKFEKCIRCERLGHSCGPAVRIERKPTKEYTVIPIASKNCLQFDVSLTTPSTCLDQEYSLSVNCLRYISTGASINKKSLTSCAEVVRTHMWSLSPLSSSEEARGMIIRLGDLNAAKEMLHRMLLHCGQVADLCVSSSTARIAIEAHIRAVEAAFVVEKQRAVTHISLGLDHDSEAIILALHLTVYRFENSSERKDASNECAGERLLQQFSHVTPQTRAICSDADLMCASAFYGQRRGGSTRNVMEVYINASRTLTHILEEVNLDDSTQRDVLPRKSISACHLAYLDGNDSAAITLWHEDGIKQPHRDMLGRTLLHLVVCQSDSQMLRRLMNYEKKAATYARGDDFGLTALHIAAGLGQFECFSILLRCEDDYKALYASGPGVLASAARNGRFKIVWYILQVVKFPFVYEDELHAAVQGGDAEIVQLLLNHHSNYHTDVNESTWIRARDMVASKGLPELARPATELPFSHALHADTFDATSTCQFDLDSDLDRYFLMEYIDSCSSQWQFQHMAWPAYCSDSPPGFHQPAKYSMWSHGA